MPSCMWEPQQQTFQKWMGISVWNRSRSARIDEQNLLVRAPTVTPCVDTAQFAADAVDP